MAFSPKRFAEDTDFERLVLDSLGTHRVRHGEPGSIHDIRGRESGGGSTIVMIGMVVSGTQLREELRHSLRPLGFGAAYKVLDMLVEHILRANAVTGSRVSFGRKKRALANRPRNLPVPLDVRPQLWDRLAVYVAFQEARHAVTHRRAQATATGALEIYDDGRNLIDTIDSTEVAAFAAAVHGMAELVIDVVVDTRRLGAVAWHLNALQGRHRLSRLTAHDPEASRRLLVTDLVALDDGGLRLDVARVKQAVDGQAPSFWDLRLHAPGNRLFVGRWEDLPDHTARAFDFHPATPPSWLSEEIPAT